MASFYAELRVAGRHYPLLYCEYSTHQATDARGRVTTKVHFQPVYVVMVVPRDNFLAAFAADAYKRCAVDIVYLNAATGQMLETLSMAGAYCVRYKLRFQQGSSQYFPTPTPSSYLLHLTLTDPDGFTIHAGGPGTYVPPAAGTHGTPLPSNDQRFALPPQTDAQELAAKKQRYNKRLSLLSRARTRLAETAPRPEDGGPFAADATRVAPGSAAQRLAEQRQRAQEATERLARNNVAVERARLSEHVYHSQEQPPRPEPLGWHMLNPQELARKGLTPDMINNPESGFKAALYQSSFERPPKLVLAYTGTEDLADWETNLKQGVGLETKQYNMAMNLAKRVVKNSPKGTVDITGHSLGGGLASAGVAVTGIKGYTFNAAGLHPATVARAPYSVSATKMAARGGLIDAYHSTADPLTNLQEHMPYTFGGLLSHAADWPISPQALGVPRPLEPAEGWQHEWVELVKRNPLTSGTNMALEGHGVDPQMVDNIEAQKTQDTATLTHYVGDQP